MITGHILINRSQVKSAASVISGGGGVGGNKVSSQVDLAAGAGHP